MNALKQQKPRQLRTFIATLQDSPGVLSRVASLFRRRAYNIVSLSVGRTHEAGVSRMTLVAEAGEGQAKLIEAQLRKLVCVLQVRDVTHSSSVLRDLALVKLSVSQEQRNEIFKICEVFRTRVVDVALDSMILEATGTPEKIQGLLDVLSPYGVEEMVQCGAVAMRRGSPAPNAEAISNAITD